VPLEKTWQLKKRNKAPPPAPHTRDHHFELFWAAVAGRTAKEMVCHLIGRDGVASERPIQSKGGPACDIFLIFIMMRSFEEVSLVLITKKVLNKLLHIIIECQPAIHFVFKIHDFFGRNWSFWLSRL
jgi:hypothetical protein